MTTPLLALLALVVFLVVGAIVAGAASAAGPDRSLPTATGQQHTDIQHSED